MKKTLYVALALSIGVPVFGGDIHGNVAVKGARDSGDAVVFVEAIAGKTFPAPKEHVQVDQSNLLFKPHVLAVLEGTTVDFLNSDAVLHNVFSPDACADKFNLGTWPKGEIRSKTFKKECVATVLCLVHPDMEGFVIVVPTPYFAVTQPDGSYKIVNVPDGAYTVKAWHAKMKPAQKGLSLAGSASLDFQLSR